jgi:hypothetical protein
LLTHRHCHPLEQASIAAATRLPADVPVRADVAAFTVRRDDERVALRGQVRRRARTRTQRKTR